MKIQRILSLAVAFVAASMSFAQSLPSGFSSTLVTDVGAPTAIAFVPDGRMLITSQGGELRVFQSGALVTTPALSFNTNSTGSEPKICPGGEQGLLGVAVDPLFATNNYIYLFYTARNGSTCGTPNYQSPNYNAANQKVNRVSRFVLGSNNVVNPTSETILVDRMPARGTNHNAGDVHFGKDGYLYISIGDGGTNWTGSGSAGGNDAARDKHILTGKILRVTRDGGIPPSNPFTGANTAVCRLTGTSGTVGNHCQETFAWGLRNPFRFAMDPNASGTRFYINDVGQGQREEVSEGESGADYGWNCREGSRTNSTTGKCSAANSPLSGMRDPVYEYPHDTTVPGTDASNCNSITGGAFVPNGIWPNIYDNTYLVADYVCGAIFRIAANGVPKYASESPPTVPITTAANFALNLGGDSATSLRFGPYGNGVGLYLTTYAGGGQVRVITYSTSGNNAPTVSALTATPQSSANAPLTTTLQATASDPDANNTLRYFWDFGDGTSSDTATASTQKTYNANGVYVVSVRARDNNFAFSAPHTVTVQVGNTPPVATITAPTVGALFSVGQNVTLTGSANDAQDGAIPNASLSWRVILHHDQHTHPFFGPQSGNNLQIVTPPPEDLAAATNSYLEVELTATDSGGLTHVVTRRFDPQKRDLNLQSSPSGRRIDVNGTSITTPQTVTVWAGWQLPVSVRDQNQGANGYRFTSWSDGGARGHDYNTPNSNSTLTANFSSGVFVPFLDVDNNGLLSAGTDGLLLLRYMLGFREANLIAGNVIGANAERTTASAIQTYLNAVLSSFDIDGRSGVSAPTDGLIALRYLLGLSGAPLTAGTGAISTPQAVKDALDALVP
jgi:glucose/arabinose dehydrogenase